MIYAVQLIHPQSADILKSDAFSHESVRNIRIACGTTKPQNADYYEASDFYPTYAPWNSALFETSVILTVWEHADELIGDNDVAIMHTDIELHFDVNTTWDNIIKSLSDEPDRAIGLTAPVSWSNIWDEWLIPESVELIPKNDSYLRHGFDHSIHIWDIIKKYDSDIYQWAMDTQPKLVYSHQFACSRKMFDNLGAYLHKMARDLCLYDTGFWTPHMFERLVALKLARETEPILTTAFWHHASSAVAGPGEMALYGPRSIKFCKTSMKAFRSF